MTAKKAPSKGGKAMGRPSSYKPEFAEQARKLCMPLKKAKEISVPIIYGLCDMQDGIVVYVGQTVNAQRRFESYISSSACHNDRLKAWIAAHGREVGFVVLESNPVDMNAAERGWIASLDGLFNVSAGGESAWMRHTSQPWMAGSGIGCPSSIVLHHLLRNSKVVVPDGYAQSIRSARDGMSMKERCLFEIGICQDILMGRSVWRDRAEKWLSITGAKLVAALEDATPCQDPVNLPSP